MKIRSSVRKCSSFCSCCSLQFQFAFEHVDQLRRVLAQHFGHRHFHRTIVLDDDDPAGNGSLAIGESVKRIDQFLRTHTARRAHFDFDFFRGKIVDALDLQLAFARRVFDGSDQRFRRGRRRNFLNHHRRIVFDFDLCADLDRAFAIGVFARIHQSAGDKIRQTFERLLFENGNLRLEQFGKIVRQNARRHSDRNAFCAEHQEQRQFAGQRDRLFVASVVARNEFSDLVVENFVARQFRQTAFDVTRSGSRIARENVSIISLAFDEITLVRQDHERVADRSITVRMILHRVTDHVRDFDKTSVIFFVQRPQDAPLHRLQTIGEIRNRAVANDVTGVFEKAGVNASMQRQLNFARDKRNVRNDNFLGENVRFTIAIRFRKSARTIAVA